MTACPLLIAAQKDADGHDTDVNAVLGSIVAELLQLLPLNLNALPLPSTAMQNDGDGHDTDDRPARPTLSSIPVGELQVPPL
jgi:hypothetical protein